MFAYVLRSINRLKNRFVPESKDLSITELNNSLTTLLKLSHREYFSEEINSFKHRNPLSGSSKLLNFDVFLDNDGLLSVGGRIKRSFANFDKKHHILLHPKHPLTFLLILYKYELSLHAGQ